MYTQRTQKRLQTKIKQMDHSGKARCAGKARRPAAVSATCRVHKLHYMHRPPGFFTLVFVFITFTVTAAVVSHQVCCVVVGEKLSDNRQLHVSEIVAIVISRLLVKSTGRKQAASYCFLVAFSVLFVNRITENFDSGSALFLRIFIQHLW